MPFHGKYRGIVHNNLDPMQQARLQVAVPGIEGLEASAWALPCLPPGAFNALPAVGSAVWVEFERGDPSYPIWCGVYWSSAADVPEGLRMPSAEGVPVAITLATADGARLQMGAHGIAISNGQGASIQLVGPSISLNQSALVVT